MYILYLLIISKIKNKNKKIFYLKNTSYVLRLAILWVFKRDYFCIFNYKIFFN